MRVSSTEIQNSFGRYLKFAEAGEEIIVTKNGRDVAKIVRIDPSVSANRENGLLPRPKGEWVTYEEYLQLVEQSDQRYELIDGVLYNLTSPSFSHQVVLQVLITTFANWFRGKSCIPLAAPFDVTLKKAENNICVVQPDLLIICDRENIDAQGKYNGVPALIVEVLSPSTAGKDLTAKMNLYMTCGVKEYWIVDPKNRGVAIYLFEKGNLADHVTFKANSDREARSFLFAGFTVPLADLFADAGPELGPNEQAE